MIFSDIAGKIFVFEILDSTQSEVKKLLTNGETPPFTVFAEQQKSGIGRFKRKWLSPKGGIYFSWATLSVPFSAAPLVIALALHKSLAKFISEKIFIKWPNDLLLENKKLAGILIETVGNTFVVGIGINTFDAKELPDEFSKSIATIALTQEKIGILKKSLFENLSPLWTEFTKSGFEPFLDDFKQCSIPVGTELCVTVGKRHIIGLYAGVNRHGALILDVSGKLRKFNAAETSLHSSKL